MKRVGFIFSTIALFLAAWLLAGSWQSAGAASGARVAPEVWRQIQAQGRADVIIQLPQPDLSPAYALPDKTARGQWVYDTLRAAAERSQPPVLAELERAGVAYQRFWVANAIQAQVDAHLLNRLLRYPQVQRIADNSTFFGAGPQPEPQMYDLTTTAAPPWGVSRVNAPWAWQQGITGQGVVVAGQDTGYNWSHEALRQSYRGFDAATGAVSHDYNWHDAIHQIDPHNSGANNCGVDSPVPCDDHGHGTHTMGTMVGNDLLSNDTNWPEAAPHPIGIAPGAQWIACRNMERGWGNPSAYIECFQWITAPWPIGGDAFSDGDPSKAPDVLNDSWSCPPDEGCTAERLAVIEPALNAADAAGILVVASAQNSGPNCSTISDPPALYPKAFTVGATDSSDKLAGFSSRGPIVYNGSTRLGPDISGPGVAVFSSIPGNVYATMSGTSMAGPHVAGVAALLLSAAPELKGQTDMIRAILTRTADPRTTNEGCGGDAPDAVPNNSFGWGIVNARNAIESLSQPASLTGVLQDATGAAVSGTNAVVRAYRYPSGEWVADGVVQSTGEYQVDVPWGRYLVVAYTPGQKGVSGPVAAVGGRETQADIVLLPHQVFLPVAFE